MTAQLAQAGRGRRSARERDAEGFVRTAAAARYHPDLRPDGNGHRDISARLVSAREAWPAGARSTTRGGRGGRSGKSAGGTRRDRRSRRPRWQSDVVLLQWPELTAHLFRRGDEWGLTGDLGRVDADASITLVDCANDMPICGGVNICPKEIR